MAENKYTKERVWDIPTRVFHWVLVLTVCTGWWLGDNLSFSNIDWHFYLGYTTGGLVVFRVLWGFIGPQSSRFSALFFRPGDVIAYLKNVPRRKPSGVAGHNPIGSLSVLALLLTLTVQVSTGLFAEADDLFSSGPLSNLVSSSTVQLANAIHEISAKVLLVLVGLHVAAVLFYLLWKGENLISAMITGRKVVKRTDSTTE